MEDEAQEMVVVFSSSNHDAEMETLNITDRNYIIVAGRVLISGDSETVLSNEDAQRAYFGKRSYHGPGMLGGDDNKAA